MNELTVSDVSGVIMQVSLGKDIVLVDTEALRFLGTSSERSRRRVFNRVRRWTVFQIKDGDDRRGYSRGFLIEYFLDQPFLGFIGQQIEFVFLVRHLVHWETKQINQWGDRINKSMKAMQHWRIFWRRRASCCWKNAGGAFCHVMLIPFASVSCRLRVSPRKHSLTLTDFLDVSSTKSPSATTAPTATRSNYLPFRFIFN